MGGGRQIVEDGDRADGLLALRQGVKGDPLPAVRQDDGDHRAELHPQRLRPPEHDPGIGVSSGR